MGDYTAIYSGAKHLDCDVIRSVAAFSGCHIYMDSGDVFYANKNYITVHASKGGEKVIRLPRAMKATEVYEGAVYSECSDEIRFKIKRGETKMFRIE